MRLSLAEIDGTSDREAARVALSLYVSLSPAARRAITTIVDKAAEWERDEAMRQISYAAESAIGDIAQGWVDRLG